MKKQWMILWAAVLMCAAVSGCGEKKEEKAPATETYVEENEVQVVYHDTENIDFRIAVIEGAMTEGLERLMLDAEKDEAANLYRFYKYRDFSEYEFLIDRELVDIATISLEQALAIYEEKPGTLCMLSVNSETEEGYGVTVANINFAKTYPAALKVFMEEMKYSAKDVICITGEEMRNLMETYLTEQEMELPGDDFYYPLSEIAEEDVTNSEEITEE